MSEQLITNLTSQAWVKTGGYSIRALPAGGYLKLTLKPAGGGYAALQNWGLQNAYIPPIATTRHDLPRIIDHIKAVRAKATAVFSLKEKAKRVLIGALQRV